MFSRLITQGLLAVTLAAGLAVAQAHEAPVAGGQGGGPSPGPLDLTLHVPPPTWLAAPRTTAEVDTPVDLHGTATPTRHGSAEYRLAPHVELLTGYDPDPAFDALDFRPRARLYAVVLKLDF